MVLLGLGLYKLNQMATAYGGWPEAFRQSLVGALALVLQFGSAINSHIIKGLNKVIDWYNSHLWLFQMVFGNRAKSVKKLQEFSPEQLYGAAMSGAAQVSKSLGYEDFSRSIRTRQLVDAYGVSPQDALYRVGRQDNIRPPGGTGNFGAPNAQSEMTDLFSGFGDAMKMMTDNIVASTQQSTDAITKAIDDGNKNTVKVPSTG